MTAVVGRSSAALLGASVMRSWVAPLLIFLLVLVAAWLGLRWIRSEHLGTIASIPLFRGLETSRLRTVLGSTRPVEFLSGDDLVTEGEVGKGFFVITKGSAVVSVSGDRRGMLSPGAYFGDVAAIDGRPRSATITAETRVSTLEITPSAFQSLLKKEPSVARAIYEELNRRLGASGGRADAVAVDPDLATLQELCVRLRAGEHPEWAQADAPEPSGVRGLLSRFR